MEDNKLFVVCNCSSAYLSVRSPLKLELPQDADQSHLSLHQSKPHPNAAARTPPKWHVCQRIVLDLLIRMEPEDNTDH